MDVAGGYVVTRKFNTVSKKRPLLEVVSAFNDLCILVKEKNSPRDLAAFAASLSQAFGADISVLARLLPNLCHVLPQLKKSCACTYSNDDQIRFR